MVMLIWGLTGLLLMFWTLAGWGLHVLLTAGPAWLAGVPGELQGLPHVDLLERWWPGWQDGLLLAGEALQAAFTWLGAAGTVVVAVVWALWAFGALLLLGLAALLSFAVRRLPAPAPAAGMPTAR